MRNGCILIDKEAGWTSFDVVSKIRGIAGQRKVGHTGTLDPDATGLLLVLLGSATRAVSVLPDHTKEYEAVMRLGLTSDTEDAGGQILSDHTEEALQLTPERIAEALHRFTGEILQVPPMYSAKKVGGRKLYELARAGKTVERQAVPVRILSIRLTEIRLPEVSLLVRCSGGTYIRSLCRDIGADLGCGALMQSLRRTEASGFRVEDARTLSRIQEMKDRDDFSFILPVDTLFKSLPACYVLPEGAKMALNGNRLPDSLVSGEGGLDEKARMYLSDRMIGIYRHTDGFFVPVKIFPEVGET